MPELPEVESIRRDLARARLVKPLVRVWRSKKKLRIGKAWQTENLKILDGARPGPVTRRGKYLIWQFVAPVGPLGLLIHLGMSGRVTLVNHAEPRVKHTHLVLTFAQTATEVRFVDPRRFGGLRAAPWAELHATGPLCDLGPEPLEPGFDGACLQRAAGRSDRALRDVLLDQRVVAGVGNIYAVEALFEARLHPLLPARRLHLDAWHRLARAVVEVLRRGIRNKGTTFRDYRDATGRSGRNQEALAVYGRAGQPCGVCGQTLRAFTHGGRSGVLCPTDQRRPRSAIVK